jgi:hypothetical protein
MTVVSMTSAGRTAEVTEGMVSNNGPCDARRKPRCVSR